MVTDSDGSFDPIFQKCCSISFHTSAKEPAEGLTPGSALVHPLNTMLREAAVLCSPSPVNGSVLFHSCFGDRSH